MSKRNLTALRAAGLGSRADRGRENMFLLCYVFLVFIISRGFFDPRASEPGLFGFASWWFGRRKGKLYKL